MVFNEFDESLNELDGAYNGFYRAKRSLEWLWMYLMKFWMAYNELDEAWYDL